MRAIAVTAVAAVIALVPAWPSSAEEVPPEVDFMELAETPLAQHDLEKGTKDGAPNDPVNLPAHIEQLTVTLPDGKHAQRADWSPDGERLIVLDAPLGNVWEYDLAT